MKKVLFFIILLLASNLIDAQTENIQSTDNDYSSRLSYSNFQNKQVIDKIANGSNISPYNFNYTVSINLQSEITKSNTGNFTLIAKYNSIKLPNLAYKNFKIPENISPDMVDFKMKFMKNGNLLKEYTISDAVLNDKLSEQNFVEQVQAVDGTNNKSRYFLKLTDVKVHYSTKSVSSFMQWASTVDDYYSANQQVNIEIDKLRTMPTNEDALASIPNLEDVFEYNQTAQNSITFVNKTKKSSFYSTLNIANNDPQNLKGNLDNLYQQALQMKTSCTNIINQIDLIYLDRGNIMYQRNLINDAVFNYNKAIEHNPKLTPAHYMLAVIAYNSADYPQTENILKNIFFNLGGDNKTLNDATNLANQLYNTYLKNADNQLSGKKFSEAIKWLILAQNWCNSMNVVNCTNDLNTKFTTAYEGKMDSFLGKVDTYVNSNQLTNASNLLNNAIAFRNDHIGFLQSDQPIRDRSTNIYNKYISNGNNFVTSKKFDLALNEYNVAKQFCANNNFVECTPELDTKILSTRQAKYNNFITTASSQINSRNYDQAEQTLLDAEKYRMDYNLTKSSNYDNLMKNVKQNQYNSAISEGKNLVNSGNYENGLTKYEHAQNIETNFNIRKNTRLASLISSAAKLYVLQKIGAANAKVIDNNLNLARILTQDAHTIAQKYNVQNDTKISAAFGDIDKKIFNQQCINYQNEYTQYYNASLNKISASKYIDADNYLQKAINLATAHVECNINMTDTKNKKQEIADAVEYQKMLNDANDIYMSRNFQSSIDKYNQTGQFFNDNNIATRYTLYHKPLADFISVRSNDFVLYGVTYFTRQDDVDNAFKMLQHLKNQGYKNKMTKTQQTLLGVKAAEKDYSSNPSGASKYLVLKYTNGDKWYKFFTKSYKKTWKKL